MNHRLKDCNNRLNVFNLFKLFLVREDEIAKIRERMEN